MHYPQQPADITPRHADERRALVAERRALAAAVSAEAAAAAVLAAAERPLLAWADLAGITEQLSLSPQRDAASVAAAITAQTGVALSAGEIPSDLTEDGYDALGVAYDDAALARRIEDLAADGIRSRRDLEAAAAANLARRLITDLLAGRTSR